MVSARRRLEAIETRIRARASPAGNRSPEEQAERSRQFRVLFRKLGIPRSPPVRDPEQVRGEMFELIASCREANDRKG